jgi:hypothetical protein
VSKKKAAAKGKSIREGIEKLFPEVNEIKDKKLRKQVIDCWVEGCEENGWKPSELEKIPFTLLAGDIDITYIEHVRTVTRMCIACADIMLDAYGKRVGYKLDRDTLIAGSLLADVGKLYEYEKKGKKIVKSKAGDYLRHPFSGVGVAWKNNVPDAVMHLIAGHSKEGEAMTRTAEAIIVNHCDFIDFDIVKYKPKKK